jgi:hypothetical protein
VFSEQGEGVGPNYAVCMRRMDGGAVVRLGDGYATGISPDGRWVVASLKTPQPHLSLLPTGPGAARTLDPGPIARFFWASFSADGRSLVISGTNAQGVSRTWIQSVEGGAPRAVTPMGIGSNWLTADNRNAILGDTLYPVAGGPARRAAGLKPGDIPAHPANPSQEVFVWRFGTLPVEVDRVDLTRGTRAPWRRLMPEDPAGVFAIGPVVVSPGGRSYAYTCGRILSDLYLADGLH